MGSQACHLTKQMKSDKIQERYFAAYLSVICQGEIVRSFKCFMLIILFSSLSSAAQNILNGSEWSGNLVDKNVVFMTTGPKQFSAETIKAIADKLPTDSTGKYYRVYFVLNEIYYSLVIEEMSFSGEEGNRIKSELNYFVSGAEFAKELLTIKRLTNFKFLRWDSPTVFLVTEGEVVIQVQIQSNNRLIVERVRDGI